MNENEEFLVGRDYEIALNKIIWSLSSIILYE